MENPIGSYVATPCITINDKSFKGENFCDLLDSFITFGACY